jgi:hypothetical protein
MFQFPLVQRCAIIVKPKRPYFDWIIKQEPSFKISLEEIQRDCRVYLVPDFEDEDVIETAIEKYLKSNYEDIFYSELSAWYTDEKMFPKITYSLFLDWFEISTNTMIFDTVDGPIDKED